MAESKEKYILDDSKKEKLYTLFSRITNEGIANDFLQNADDPRLSSIADLLSDSEPELVKNGGNPRFEVVYGFTPGRLSHLDGTSTARYLRRLGKQEEKYRNMAYALADALDKPYSPGAIDSDGRVA